MANRPDIHPTADHLAKAQSLLRETAAHGGLAPVDLEKFWHDQEIASKNPFAPDIPQCPMNIPMSGECVWDELGIPEDYYRYDHDPAWRRELNIAYNNQAEKIVGRRLLSETFDDPALHYPPTKALHDIFEAKNEWHGWSWWLQQSAHSEHELSTLLDRVDRRLENLRPFILPPNWSAEKARLLALGIKPPLYRWQRGPCTFATSILGTENMLMLCLDNPALTIRLRDTILRAMLALAHLLDEEAGPPPFTPATAPRGFAFADDNCCLFNPEMYELFALPILRTIFQTYAPSPTDSRYQHSDSPMAHLLPLLGTLHLTGTNFGPTVTITEIRRHLPHAAIDGQLAPFTFSNNESERLILEFLRDFDQAKDSRGLRFATAGSINNGSRLTSLRLIMSALQHFGRYHP